MDFGILTLLPILVLFILIFTTKRMLLSLTAASFVGAIMLGGLKGFAGIWLEKVQTAFMAGFIRDSDCIIGFLRCGNRICNMAEQIRKYKKKGIINYILIGMADICR